MMTTTTTLSVASRTRRRMHRRLSATLAFVAIATSMPLAAGHAGAQTAEDAGLRELAVRALNVDPSGTAELLPGKLAETQPALMFPAGWRLIGSVIRKNGPASAATVYLDAPGSPSPLLDVLATTMVAAGWRRYELPTYNSGGFQGSNSTQYAMLLFCGSGQTFSNVTAVRASTGPSAIALTVSTYPGSSPCGQSGGPVTNIATGPPGVFSQLPRLVLPSTWTVVTSNGGSGSQFSTGSTIVADGTPMPADAAKTLEPQMTAAGWKRIGDASDENVASSLWRKTADAVDYQAVLTIDRAIGGDRRSNFAITVSTKADASGFGQPPLISPVLIPPPPFPTVAPRIIIATPPTKRATSKKKAT